VTSSIDGSRDDLTIDTMPSEELTALAFTILNRSIEEPELAKQLEPYEWSVLIVDNAKRETGRAVQTFNPPADADMSHEDWALARSMMLQFRDISAAAKKSPEMRTIALAFCSELLALLAQDHILAKMNGAEGRE